MKTIKQQIMTKENTISARKLIKKNSGEEKRIKEDKT